MIRLASLIVMIGAVTAMAAETVYVAPAALAGDGTQSRPLSTLTQALQVARSTGSRHIVLAAGEYFDTSVTLEPRDSGMVIEGPGATLYGGIVLSPTAPQAGLLYCPVPAEVNEPIRLLVVDGALAQRARYPATGTLEHNSVFAVRWLSTTDGGWERKPTDEELSTMRFVAGQIPPTLSARNAEITVYHMWDESCVPVESIDFEKGIVHFSQKLGHPAGAFDVKRYVIWNTQEGLTVPGSFYHDREKGQIVYRLRDGEKPRRLLAATRAGIINLQGTEKEPVQNVTIRDLKLQATTASLIPGGWGALQLGGAINLLHCRGIHIDGVHISNCAAHGITCGWVKVSDCVVENTVADQCGAGGICVRGKKNVLRNNRVSNTGFNFPAGTAIYADGDDVLIEGNRIESCSYTGICAAGNGNTVRRNLIIRAMRDLYDGGAIYVTSAKNSIIEENVCRDIGGKGGYNRVGYYLDEQSENTIVRRNIAINVDVPLQAHMSRNCIFEDNVMRNSGDLRIHAAKCENLTLRRNVAMTDSTLTISGVNSFGTISDNILFSVPGHYAFLTLDKYATIATANTPPTGIIATDPGFLDAISLHYRPDSPARKMSLPELNLSMAGR